MTLRGIDISNHQGPPTTYQSLPWYTSAEFVIVQAIAPPAPYAGWDVGGYTAQQLRAAQADGKKVGVYLWLWDALSNTAADIRARLALIPDDVALDMRLWLDVEDTSTNAGPSRQQDVLDALAVMDEWSTARGLPPAGVYSGDWYIGRYLDGWFPPERVYWMADYELEPTVLPMRPVHQFSSTPIDQNLMLESEVLDVPVVLPSGDEVDLGWQDKKDLVVQTAGELLAVADQLTSEANRKGGPRVRETRRLASEVRARATTILS